MAGGASGSQAWLSEGVGRLHHVSMFLAEARAEAAAAYLASILHDLGTRDRLTGVEHCKALARVAGNEAAVERILAGN